MKARNKGASCVQQRQRERLQIEQAHSFGVVGIQPMLPELTQLALAEAGQRRTPITIGCPAANVGLVARISFY